MGASLEEQQRHELHVKPTLDTALEVFLELVRDDDGVPHHP